MLKQCSWLSCSFISKNLIINCETASKYTHKSFLVAQKVLNCVCMSNLSILHLPHFRINFTRFRPNMQIKLFMVIPLLPIFLYGRVWIKCKVSTADFFKFFFEKKIRSTDCNLIFSKIQVIQISWNLRLANSNSCQQRSEFFSGKKNSSFVQISSTLDHWRQLFLGMRFHRISYLDLTNRKWT